MNSFNIAFFADSHLGYSYASVADTQGVNLRVRDGYNAMHEIISGILDSEEHIDAVVHGGDLFHDPHPTIRDIATAQHYLRLLWRAGLPFYGLAGNHDASDDRSLLAAVAVVDDPERNIHALWKPYAKQVIGDGIMLHSVAHHGLKGERAPEITPATDMINIFTTHGAALDPKNATLMRCMDSPREQIIPPELVLSDAFSVRLLGHYHSRYAVGGPELNTWYAGSAIRRGFSDAKGARGWLLVRVFPDGRIEIETHDIYQRPQFDFQAIDGSDLTGAEIEERILANIMSTREDGLESDTIDLIGAPILRQRILNTTRFKREGVDRALLNSKASHALKWQLEFMRPSEETILKDLRAHNHETDDSTDTNDITPDTETIKKPAGNVNMSDQFLGWASKSRTLAQVDKGQRAQVGDEAHRHIKSTQDAGE